MVRVLIYWLNILSAILIIPVALIEALRKTALFRAIKTFQRRHIVQDIVAFDMDVLHKKETRFIYFQLIQLTKDLNVVKALHSVIQWVSSSYDPQREHKGEAIICLK